jgi:FkbM family methyltransferase
MTACAELELLLNRDLDAERIRERSWYDQLTRERKGRLVLFGAGNHGRRILNGLRSVGAEPLAFADNNPVLWGKAVEGIPVYSPQESAKRFGNEASFLVTVFSHGKGHSFQAFNGQLRSLGCTSVLPFAPLFWKHADIFLPDYSVDLPHKVVQDAESVRAAYRLWADDLSRREYLEQLHWRLAPDAECFSPPRPEEFYLPSGLIDERNDEVFVDCGAFDGDTVRAFLKSRGERFRRVVAFEPDPKNYEALSEYVSGLPERVSDRIDLHRTGTGLRRETVRFSATGNMGAAITPGGEIEITCVPLDEVLADLPPTYIKMDIEGAEPDALAGAAELIRRHSPVLAICVYHRQDHIWQIPLQISALHSGYEFFLRRYSEECWDVVCYAVPRSRRRHA